MVGLTHSERCLIYNLRADEHWGAKKKQHGGHIEHTVCLSECPAPLKPRHYGAIEVLLLLLLMINSVFVKFVKFGKLWCFAVYLTL